VRHWRRKHTSISKSSKSSSKSSANESTANWLNELVVGDSTFDPGIAVATYDPGAKLQDRFCSSAKGVGYYQEKGKPARIVPKGDVIKCPPGVEHWHAAAPNSTFAYIAVTPTSKGKTIWLGQ
jgi:quercetin dioxygenase-like cupin family protein